MSNTERTLLIVLSSCDECPYMRDVDPYPQVCTHADGPRYAEIDDCHLPGVAGVTLDVEMNRLFDAGLAAANETYGPLTAGDQLTAGDPLTCALFVGMAAMILAAKDE